MLDWGQVKSLNPLTLQGISRLFCSLKTRKRSKIIRDFLALGIKVENVKDEESIEGLAVTMFDTRDCPGYVKFTAVFFFAA